MYIGIDIGGTHTRVVVGENGKYFAKRDFPTNELEETLSQIKQSISNLDAFKAKAIGVAVAGPVDHQKQILYHPPNLPSSWRGKNVSNIFTDKIGIKTFIGHDASVAALGEAIYGAGKDKNPVLYYTVSTGIGSGLVVNGNIYHGIFNPEAGHQIFSREGEPCDCGQLGDLESLASGKSLQKKTGKEPIEVEGSDTWREAMEWIAIGVANSILHFSPEIVVIGGGMTKNKEIFFAPINEALKKYLKFTPPVPVVPSGLGQDSSLIGALELAQSSS